MQGNAHQTFVKIKGLDGPGHRRMLLQRWVDSPTYPFLVAAAKKKSPSSTCTWELCHLDDCGTYTIKNILSALHAIAVMGKWDSRVIGPGATCGRKRRPFAAACVGQVADVPSKHGTAAAAGWAHGFLAGKASASGRRAGSFTSLAQSLHWAAATDMILSSAKAVPATFLLDLLQSCAFAVMPSCRENNFETFATDRELSHFLSLMAFTVCATDECLLGDDPESLSERPVFLCSNLNFASDRYRGRLNVEVATMQNVAEKRLRQGRR